MRFTLLIEKLWEKGFKRHVNEKMALEKALQWVKDHTIPGGGVLRLHNEDIQSQEVTGYLIPSLYKFGERKLAKDLAKWEASVQRPDGAFTAIDNVPYTFDTAQVIRGFLAVLDDMPELEGNLRRACDYVESQIAANGEVLTPSYDMWQLSDGNMLSEYGNLYVLPPLLEAGKKLSEARYVDAAMRGVHCFKRKPDLVEFKPDLSTISHYFGYMMEALVDLGEVELAEKGLRQAAAVQRRGGAIPAYPGVDWVCSTGVAQLALAWYKLGRREYADKAISYLMRIQNPSGGFYGSYGEGANYFPTQEISWAVKFFLDACYWKIKTDFDMEVDWPYYTSIDEADGRVKEMLSFFGDLRGKRVIDVGCGKGPFLRVLKGRFPEAGLYGLDISDKMLSFCPEGVETTCGSMLNIKYPDGYFDCVFSSEALEHAVCIKTAIKEMVRILKSGGKILIIDKDSTKLGALKLKPWETWFNPDELTHMLRKYGIDTQSKAIAYGDLKEPDGLFIAWEGLKGT